MRHGGVYTSAHPLPSDGDPPCRDTLDKAATGPEGPELSKAFNPPMSLPLNYTLYRSLATPLPPQMYFLPSTLTFFPVCTGLNASTEIRSSDEDFFCPLGLDDLVAQGHSYKEAREHLPVTSGFAQTALHGCSFPTFSQMMSWSSHSLKKKKNQH